MLKSEVEGLFVFLNESRLAALLVFFTFMAAFVFALTLMYFSDRLLKVLLKWQKDKDSLGRF